ncbi:hypothetical protein OVA29_05515 [Exiguobacterium sp. SL14]|nr:hypothetical protein [Exiguobacterium sp. SL14]MCY1690300.1 hypothetical protein [Exiguobacterium sp. SL14]
MARAEFLSFQSIRVEVEGNPSICWSLECDGESLAIQQTETHREEQLVIYELTVLEPVALECRYEVLGAGKSIRVVPDRLVRTEAFERKYRYEGKLGVWEEAGAFQFAVWSLGRRTDRVCRVRSGRAGARKARYETTRARCLSS